MKKTCKAGEEIATQIPITAADEPDQGHLQSLFELIGLGREHFKGIDPDDHVKRLREGWN